MEQHIKLFSTDSARTAYESSANYEVPYVSKVIADNSVHYNKVVQLITFQIIDRIYSTQYECHAEEGMTWEDWTESNYNTLGLISVDCVIAKSNEDYEIFDDNYDLVSCLEQIVGNRTYYADS